MDEPACLTEAELVARIRQCVWPGPVVHVGPAYPIKTFAAWDQPFPGYFHGIRVIRHEGLMDQAAVEEIPPNG